MTDRLDSEIAGEFLLTARSLAEYRAMFALGADELRGRILDCPGGAASFACEAVEFGAEVIAVDPCYAQPAGELREIALADTDRGNAWSAAHTGLYSWDWYGGDPAVHRRMRHDAVRRFTADLSEHPGRYIAAALPALPFSDNTFDLVLSSHLLFTYADRLNADFHLAALLELARVSRGEVRLYPLLDHSGEDLAELVAWVRAELRARGVGSALRPTVAYEFQRGADRQLVLNPQPSVGVS
ncbi:class I SAM-dependent methyltransferase [Nocardia yamanashiensis]|uniref:methyltransferase domain-containing protein n=1 Tax=Nocardia yamanashiensis TaxID=209247 RepID=UPI001E60054D|nr:methyltransferase domain-containing protein [Nocardia yamanashiensis]UGT38770.1 class I SAM-dependent methyltransferase [Nocardia yamanashiensis]